MQLILFNRPTQSALALMDGGSSHSFISPSILTQLQIKLQNYNNEADLNFNSEMKIRNMRETIEQEHRQLKQLEEKLRHE